MNFSKVPLNIQFHIEKLTEDEVFQKRFAEDEVLDQLEQLKYNPFIQYNQLQLLLHNKVKFFGLAFNPITLALWSFLYTIKSPIIFKQKDCTMVDLDLFFYLLQTGNFNSTVETLIKNSTNYCKNVLQLSEEQVKQIMQKLVKVSFRVLNMFPKYSSEDCKPVFNVDWLTSIATKVCQVSNYNIQEVYTQISVCEAFYLFAQYCREKGSEAIFLRTEEEILQEEDLRATTLLVERLIELNVLEEKDKQFYINIIHDQENE